jgi:hypothetical protein
MLLSISQLHLLDHLGPSAPIKNLLGLNLGATLNQMMRMSQEGKWKTKRVSEKNRPYTASATAKRFSSTIK